MADKNIGMLPQASQLDDDSLFILEQQGAAMRLTGRQLKDYAKQGVELEFREDLEASRAAADRAQSAASAVVDMTVEAHPSSAATVTKSTLSGKVNLAFGLPRGEPGEPGPEGKTGPRGPKGDPGTGLRILGYYDTLPALEAAVPAPEAGDACGVGAAAPYDVYVYDGASGQWKNNGPLSGGGGVLPENAVTSEGGAVLEIPVSFGDAPHTVSFTDGEEPPLTAEDVQYSGTQTVKEAMDGLFTSVGDGKAAVASAITGMGVPTAQDAAFSEMAENIRQIRGGADTSDASATPGDILSPKTAYTSSGKVEGIIPTLAAQTILPGTADKTIAGGQYLGGTQVIRGDPNLAPANIKSGVTLFGVQGALESAFMASLTVTADAGAVVTATHSGGTEVSALSANGNVTLELPLEGQWTVTARRGVAQYNSVVIDVSSSYAAKLTAEVHIVRVGAGTPLSEARYYLAATNVGSYALFGGGLDHEYGTTGAYTFSDAVDAYNQELTKSRRTLSQRRQKLAAASVGEYALFGGGCREDWLGSGNTAYNTVDAFNASLTRSTTAVLSKARYGLSGASAGNYALFAGGTAFLSNESTAVATVDAYNETLTRFTPTELISPGTAEVASSVGNYALFAGGNDHIINAYSDTLTRSTPTPMSGYVSAGTKAGSYAVFAGNTDCSAYDLTLTRTIGAPLSISRGGLAATSIGQYGLFGGGNSSSGVSAAVDAYDMFLTRTTPTALDYARYSLNAAAVGNYALFGGGTADGKHGINTVEIYQYV